MASITLHRGEASAFTAALAAVLDDRPDAPIELSPGVYVRASYLVDALAPIAVESLLMARQFVESRGESVDGPRSIRAALVRQFGGAAA